MDVRKLLGHWKQASLNATSADKLVCFFGQILGIYRQEKITRYFEFADKTRPSWVFSFYGHWARTPPFISQSSFFLGIKHTVIVFHSWGHIFLDSRWTEVAAINQNVTLSANFSFTVFSSCSLLS